jgi:hypothetical protein
MALKFKLKSKDEVPTELAGHYVERDGSWLLDVEGAVDPASVKELRLVSPCPGPPLDCGGDG